MPDALVVTGFLAGGIQVLQSLCDGGGRRGGLYLQAKRMQTAAANCFDGILSSYHTLSCFCNTLPCRLAIFVVYVLFVEVSRIKNTAFGVWRLGFKCCLCHLLSVAFLRLSRRGLFVSCGNQGSCLTQSFEGYRFT